MTDDLNKRYTDHLEKTSDHDLLIKLNTKMDSVCVALKDKPTSIDHAFEMLNASCAARKTACDKTLDSKITGTTFWKLVAILTVILGIMFTATTKNTIDIAKNIITIMHNQETIHEKHK